MINELKYLYHTLYTWINPRKHKAKVLSTLARSRKRWTATEISDLIYMFENATPINIIADELDRPEAGVRSKLISLGYSTRKES